MVRQLKRTLHPIRVFALVEYGGVETTFMESVGIDKKTTITVHFHKRRLTEDQNLLYEKGILSDMERSTTK